MAGLLLNCVTMAVILTLTLLIGYGVVTADCVRLQQITLYANNGTTENYTSDVPDLTKVSQIIRTNQLESICSQVGVWAFFTSPGYKDSSASYGYHPATPQQWSCNERRVSAYMTPYKSLRHLGNLDLDQSGISLFSEQLFAQDAIYFNGDALSLPAAFHMNSFGFTGADNWTIFSNPSFSGDAVCLCSENNGVGGERNNYNENSGSGISGVTFEERLSFSVGSLRRSCYGSQVWLVNGEFIRPQEILNSSVVSAEEFDHSSMYLDSLPAIKMQPASHYAPMYVAGQELNLPFPIRFENFTAQMDSEWRIFAQVDFRGNSICIRGSGSFNNSAGIGSIRAGCNETQDFDYSTDYPLEYTSLRGRPRYDYETTTNVAYDSTAVYADYENSIEHAQRNQNAHGQQGNRKEYGRVTSTFSVTELEEERSTDPRYFGSTAAPGGHFAGTGSSFDESNDGLPTARPRPGTTPYTVTPQSGSYGTSTGISRNPYSPAHGSTSYGTSRAPTPDRGSFGRNLRPTEPSTGVDSDEASTRRSGTTPFNVNDAIRQFYNTSSNSVRNQTQQGQERISTADTNSIFFTAFIITLILLFLCILLAIGVFVYFRSTRKGSGEVRPALSSAQSQPQSLRRPSPPPMRERDIS